MREKNYEDERKQEVEEEAISLKSACLIIFSNESNAFSFLEKFDVLLSSLTPVIPFIFGLSYLAIVSNK